MNTCKLCRRKVRKTTVANIMQKGTITCGRICNECARNAVLLVASALYDAHANASQMNREHAAWRQVCRQLKLLGVDINEQKPLACAIRLWGEELVALREENPEHTTMALFERRADYVEHIIGREDE